MELLAQVSDWTLLLGFGLVVAVWLMGLIVVLRGTTPPERVRIIEAYGRAFPGQRDRRRGPAGGRRST